MKLPKIVVKDKRRALLAVVAGLGVILLAYGILRATTSIQLPPRLDKDLPDFIIFAAFAAFLYGRQLTREEEKAAAKKAEEEAARAKASAGGDGALSSEDGANAGDASAAGGSPSADPEGGADHRD